MSELSAVAYTFASVWGLVMELKIGSFPVVYAFLAMIVIGVLIRFVKGKK